MPTPRISVILATYNCGHYLDAAVRSILDQTFRDFEFLIMDDGSTDHTESSLQRLAERDSRIRLFKNASNCGLVASLNTLIEHAQGPFIARMDGDDIALPERLADQLDFMESTNTYVCGTWAKRFGQLRKQPIKTPVADDEIRATMLFQNPFSHPSIMMHRRIFDDGTRYRECAVHAEDYDLFARIAPHFKLGNLPKPLILYRKHAEQVSESKTLEQWRSAEKIRRNLLASTNISANEREQELHGRVRAPFTPESHMEIEALESWLCKLATHFHNSETYCRVIGLQWFLLAVRSASYGRWMWEKYRKSPLRELYSPSNFQVHQLRGICMIRLTYRSWLYRILEQFTN